jgi:hypothetical protein
MLANEIVNLCPEIFLTDKYGCNVAVTNKTTDFWQGDEDKFLKSFCGGKGKIYVGKAYYDRSTRLVLRHVSIPVYDPDSENAIGVLVVGVNIHALLE